MWFHHNLTSSPVSLLSWQLGFHERGLVFTSQKKLITKPQVKYQYSPYQCRLPNSPIISLITQNHQISGTVSSFPSDVANLSFQSCLTVALTSLLSFARLLPLLFSFIQSPLMSHPDNRDTIPHSPCLQTFFPRIHLPYHLLITLSSLFPYTNCKKRPTCSGFPFLGGWVCLHFHILRSYPHWAASCFWSRSCDLLIPLFTLYLFLGIPSPLQLVLKSYSFFRDQVKYYHIHQVLPDPPQTWYDRYLW